MVMFKKVSDNFLNKRLTATNIKKYLQENYNFGDTITEVYRKQLSVPIFLQNNYGKEGDCTLTSVLTLTKFYNKSLDTNEVYNYIENIAEKKYFYNGDSFGTIPFFNRAIINETCAHFGIKRDFKTGYLKGVGFNLNSIIQLINDNTPIMISMFKDGRKYYDSHTITIVGYVVYEDENHKQQVMLQVYDNWHSSYSFLDYNLVCNISMICY